MRNFLQKKYFPLLCCAILLLAWLVWAVFIFIYDHAQPQTALLPAEAQTVELQATEQGTFKITGGDPQLVFTNLNLTARRVLLQADFAKDPGELDLYYAQKEGQGFSPVKRVWARARGEGVFEYQLPPGRYTALRLDLGASGTNTVQIHSITLNTPAPTAQYFLPTLRHIGAFVLLPALASCAFYIIIEIVVYLKARRKEPPTA